MELATPLFHEDIHLRQLFIDLLRIGTILIDFVDSEDHGYTRRLCVADGFLGLRHHRIISSNNDHSKIRNLGTTGTHRSEGFVTWRIEECDGLTTGKVNVISTNMLCDTSGLTGNHIGITDIVEQRCFTMVNVTHDGNNRRSWRKIICFIFFILFLHFHLLLHIDEFHFIPEFSSNQFNNFCVETLVDGNHDAEAHTLTDDLSKVHIQQTGQLTYTDKFCNLDLVVFTFSFSTGFHFFTLESAKFGFGDLGF